MDSKSLSRPLYDSSSPAKTEFDDTRSLPSLFKKEGIWSKSMSFFMQLNQLFICIASIMILGCIGLAIKMSGTFNWLSCRSSNKMDETHHLFRSRGRPARKPPETTKKKSTQLLSNRSWFALVAILLIAYRSKSFRVAIGWKNFANENVSEDREITASTFTQIDEMNPSLFLIIICSLSISFHVELPRHQHTYGTE